MKAFEKVVQHIQEKNNRPVHTVVQYNYTMEGIRDYMLDITRNERTMSFEKIFEVCENRIHAIFIFLNMLELVQQKFMTLIVGEGRNNFILEYNEHREEEQSTQLSEEDWARLN